MTIKQLVKLLKKNNQQVELYTKGTYSTCGNDSDCFSCEHYDESLPVMCNFPDDKRETRTVEHSLFKGRPFEVPIVFSDATVISLRSEYFYPYAKSHGPESMIRIEIKERQE